MEQVIYIKYNKLRRPEFRISTMICEENGKRTVIKKALTREARAQIRQIYNNSQEIGRAYEGLEILLPQYEEDRVVYDFIAGKNLEQTFVVLLDNHEALLSAIEEGLKRITAIVPQYRGDFQVTDAYREVFGNTFPESPEAAVTYSNIDVLFDNIIIRNGQYICLDCEWVFHFPIPVKFIEYRSLFYFYQKYEAYLRKQWDLETFLKNFGISPEEKKVFMEMERQFQIYVVGQDFTLR